MDELTQKQAELDAANAELARLKAGQPDVNSQLAAAQAEIEWLRKAQEQTVDIPVNTKRVVVPREFPDGFGFAGRRDSLQSDTREYLQRCWDSLTSEQKVRHVLALEQHVPQPVPQSPHRMAA